VRASLLQNVDNKLPGDTASHLSSKDTECSSSNPVWNWLSSGTHEPKETEAKF